ncbi:MAG TPA: Ig-like domain-containing protein, partial [Longimicrobiales bacterium]|nr:Ig-like domain-containing protein [Longimicrobiales bacterium]
MRPRTPAGTAAAMLCLAGALIVSCARPFPPPGGERDVIAPRLVSTSPEPLAVVPASDEPAVFRFNERISERGFSEMLVTVSPLDSTLRVERSGSEVRVGIEGGWRPNRVYRIVLLPGVRDLFGNERREPVELVFSTGTPIGNTALAGIVIDRITGEPAPQAVVDAVHRGVEARYRAIADSSGFYSLRYLPLGEYDVHAYDDQNRNRRRDTLEPVDSGHTAMFSEPTDTVALVFNVLSPDTSAPRIVSARAADSLHVEIEMDDYFDPVSGLESARAEVIALPDSTTYAAAIVFIPEPVFRAERDAAQRRAAEAERLAADSARAAGDTVGIAADSIVRDTIAAADTAAVRADDLPVAEAAAAPDLTLPIREFVVTLDRPLPPGSYVINLAGVVNLHGLTANGASP